MPILAVHHVNLAMPSGGEDAARRFYGELLGFAEIEKPAGSNRNQGCWFETGDVQVHISEDPDFHPAKVAHPGFLVEDLLSFRRRLEMAKTPTKDGTNIPGFVRCFVFDPFGNRIELLQRA